MAWHSILPRQGWSRCARAGRLAAAAAGAVSLCGCFVVAPSRGGGQIEGPPPPHGRLVRPADVAVPAGYQIEAVATGLTFPTSVAFDDAGGVFVAESGYSYGEVFTTPRLLRVEPGGQTRVVAKGERGPWNGVTYAKGAFYVAEGGEKGGGRILKITPDGAITPLVDDLPSTGDHHTNGPVLGPNGMLYFGQGTATNSGVVGPDNAKLGWLPRYPQFHDTPCKDVSLAGMNYTTKNPLTPDEDDEAVTGAYLPFGTRSEAGQVIKGQVPCSGAILRVPITGGAPELVAWGLRNPYGLAFSPEGRLFVTENGFDERGSRPVFGAADFLWEIREGAWYGWPDFVGGEPVWQDQSTSTGAATPARLLAEHPSPPPRPVASFGVHSSSNRFDFSRSRAFGHAGEAFVAQFGDMAPSVGKVLSPVGFRVARVDVETGVIHAFAANKGGRTGRPRGSRGAGSSAPSTPISIRAARRCTSSISACSRWAMTR
jgi:glucose/arabinose dehydrogenase